MVTVEFGETEGGNEVLTLRVPEGMSLLTSTGARLLDLGREASVVVAGGPAYRVGDVAMVNGKAVVVGDVRVTAEGTWVQSVDTGEWVQA